MGRHKKGCDCESCKNKPKKENDNTEIGLILEKFPDLSKEDISKLNVEKVNEYYDVLNKMDDEKLSRVLLTLNSNFDGQYNCDNENIFAVKRFLKEKSKNDWANKLFTDNKGKKITKIYSDDGKLLNVDIEGIGTLKPTNITEKEIKDEIEDTKDDEYTKMKEDLKKELTEKAQGKEKDVEQLEKMKGDLETLEQKVETVKKDFKISDHLKELLDDYLKKIAKTIVSMEVTIAKRLTGKIPRIEIQENLIDAWNMFFDVYCEMELEKILKYLPIIFLVISHVDLILDVLPDKTEKDREKVNRKDKTPKIEGKGPKIEHEKDKVHEPITKEIEIDPIAKRIKTNRKANPKR